MSVDKFGRKFTISSKKSDVSLSLINHNYVRRDGTNSITGSINMTGNTFTNVSNPVNPQDVATKNYVDSTDGDLDLKGYRITNLGSALENSDAINLESVKDEIAIKAVHKNGDIMTGELNMSKNNISNLKEPSANNDAVTKEYCDGKPSKKYVDNLITQVRRNTLALDGTTKPTQNLDFDYQRIKNVGWPAHDNDAATKKFVEMKAGLRLNPTDLIGNGNIDMNNNNIINLADPKNDQDAATKRYADFTAHSTANLTNKKVLLLDGSNKPINDINFNNMKIYNLRNPTNNHDSVNKLYCDSQIRKPVISVHAEENAAIHKSNYEWSFGNGGDGTDHGLQGYCMPVSGRILRASLTAVADLKRVDSEIRVNIVKNRIEQQQYTIIKPANEWVGCITFRNPLELKECDIINFISKTENLEVTTATIVILIELDL